MIDSRFIPLVLLSNASSGQGGSNIENRTTSRLSLSKNEIMRLAPNSGSPGDPLNKTIRSLFNWVDCGAHSPHWCNTGCGIPQTGSGTDGDSDCESNSKL